MKQPDQVIILGTGGNCVDILEIIDEINRRAAAPIYECRGFLDDAPQLAGQSVAGVPVLGPLSAAGDYPECRFVNGIGSTRNFWKREAIIRKTGLESAQFITLVHPTASISPSARLGTGTVVLQLVTVANSVSVGRHVTILPNTVISHDVVIGDYSILAGGVCLSGGVRVGGHSYLGSNCCIRENVAVGERCLVGMGSVVLEDIRSHSVVAGNPARFLRKTDE